MLFGAFLIPIAVNNFTLMNFIYAILSLTVVRISAIYLSLLGTKTDVKTKLFFGWFGPRGLASILFTVLILDDLSPEQRSNILSVISLVVLMSIIFHGMSALPLSKKLSALSSP